MIISSAEFIRWIPHRYYNVRWRWSWAWPMSVRLQPRLYRLACGKI